LAAEFTFEAKSVGIARPWIHFPLRSEIAGIVRVIRRGLLFLKPADIYRLDDRVCRPVDVRVNLTETQRKCKEGTAWDSDLNVAIASFATCDRVKDVSKSIVEEHAKQ
jgi:hypothetical protein